MASYYFPSLESLAVYCFLPSVSNKAKNKLDMLCPLGLLKDGYELISQAMTLFSNICGVLHDDVCSCLRLLGRLSYILGDYTEVNNNLCFQSNVIFYPACFLGVFI